MPRLLFVLLCVTWLPTTGQSNFFEKGANDAFLITRMAAKFHVQPRQINDSFSVAVFQNLLALVDDDKLFFTRTDISSLEQQYKYKLDEEIIAKKSSFLKAFAEIYQKRLLQADSIAAGTAARAMNLFSHQAFKRKEQIDFAADVATLGVKWQKTFRYLVIDAIADIVDELGQTDAKRMRQLADSLEPIERQRVFRRIHRFIQRSVEGPGGVERVIAEAYCKAIANAYDPHTAYMSATDKENFESMLGKSNYAFGFSIDEDDDGAPVVEKLKPGSPAFRSGMMNAGDKIISLQWGNNKPIDVSDASLQELEKMLTAHNHERVVFVIKKQDGTTREVVLDKEIETAEENDDDDWVRSFVLTGQKKIGYIVLPSFYEDWENEVNINGCANDVAKEIIKLKKENIEGLVIDLRYNGGGSTQEAVELSGIFIDAGPVVMVKTREDKLFTGKDVNRGTIYDGPLTVMVNGYSASASELFAACMQDYNRAIVVGSSTYGKGTAQNILPLDTSVTIESLETYKGGASSYVKLTMAQCFRVNGTTTQYKGVLPDVVVPDFTDASKKERAETNAIPYSTVEPNKYYRPLTSIVKDSLRARAEAEVSRNNYFAEAKKYIHEKNGERFKDIDLNLYAYLDRRKLQKTPESDSLREEQKLFTVVNHGYDQERLKHNNDLKESNELYREYIRLDPHLKLVYLLMQ